MPRNATQEEITAAYKKLSRFYHPDKHREEDKQKKAEVMFSKLKNAYEGKFYYLLNSLQFKHLGS